MNRLMSALRALGVTLLLGAVAACARGEEDWVLPDPGMVTEWFGESAEARLDGNVLEIRGRMEPDHLRRGGRIWARSGPYFYLFNVHVQRILVDYPDVAAVRARTFDQRGQEVATATLSRDRLSEFRWDEALARASLAQQEGTRSPRLVERLISFGEDHTEYTYSGADTD
ncbi:MAG: hypothetical protein WD766_12570 [Gemmatimonadota bacterium]